VSVVANKNHQIWNFSHDEERDIELRQDKVGPSFFYFTYSSIRVDTNFLSVALCCNFITLSWRSFPYVQILMPKLGNPLHNTCRRISVVHAKADFLKCIVVV